MLSYIILSIIYLSTQKSQFKCIHVDIKLYVTSFSV